MTKRIKFLIVSLSIFIAILIAILSIVVFYIEKDDYTSENTIEVTFTVKEVKEDTYYGYFYFVSEDYGVFKPILDSAVADIESFENVAVGTTIVVKIDEDDEVFLTEDSTVAYVALSIYSKTYMTLESTNSALRNRSYTYFAITAVIITAIVAVVVVLSIKGAKKAEELERR